MAARRYANRRHKGLRARLAPVVASGRAVCNETVCLEERAGRTRAITPGTPWDLAHSDDGLTYKGPAHARCNRADGARRGNAKRVAPKRRAL
jgi:hypothetical protein